MKTERGLEDMSQYPPPSYEQPQPEQMQPPPQFLPQFPKKPKRWPWIVAIFVALMFGYAAGIINHSIITTTDTTTAIEQPVPTLAPIRPTSVPVPTLAPIQPTSVPVPPTIPPKQTAVPVWTTTHTFSGNGAQKTETFSAPDDWKLNWSCNPAISSMGSQYNIIVDVNNSDGTPLDPAAINTLCKTGNTSGSTEERQSGSIYLDVNSEDNWTITVQELK